MRKTAFFLKLSRLNLFRNPRRTLLLLSTLAIGLGYIIFTLNLSHSSFRKISEDIVSQYVGYSHLTHPEYYSGNTFKRFNFYKTISKRDAQEFITPTSVFRVTTPVLIAEKQKGRGALLVGIGAQKEGELNKLKNTLTKGVFFDNKLPRQLIMGERLADIFSLKIGDEVAILGVSLDGSVAQDLFTLVGIMDLGGGGVEENIVFTRIEDAQEFSSIPQDTFHQLVEFSSDQKKELPQKLRSTPWNQQFPEVSRALHFTKNFMILISLVLMVVISFGMSNSVNITFIERERELLLYNTLGLSYKMILASLFFEVSFLLFFGLLLGNLLGLIVSLFFYFYPFSMAPFMGGKSLYIGGHFIHPLIQVVPELKNHFLSSLCLIGCLLVSFIYPALRVRRRCQRLSES